MRAMDAIDGVLQSLNRSRFRRRFALGPRERRTVAERGLATVLDHGRSLLRRRLAPAAPDNDGRQTPMRGHPIFIAQHATATCCRSCLHKWHRLPRDRALSEQELDYVLTVIERWLLAQPLHETDPTQGHLFDTGDASAAQEHEPMEPPRRCE